MDDDLRSIRIVPVQCVTGTGHPASDLGITMEIPESMVQQFKRQAAIAPVQTQTASVTSVPVPESWEDAAEGIETATPAVNAGPSRLANLPRPVSVRASMAKTSEAVQQEENPGFDFEQAATQTRLRSLSEDVDVPNEYLAVEARANRPRTSSDDDGNAKKLYAEAQAILSQFESLAAEMGGIQELPGSTPMGAGLASMLEDAGIVPNDDGSTREVSSFASPTNIGTLRRQDSREDEQHALSLTDSVARMRAQLEALRPETSGADAADYRADDESDGEDGGEPDVDDAVDADDGAASEGGLAAGAPMLLLDVSRFAADTLEGEPASQLSARDAAQLVRQVWAVLTGSEPYEPLPEDSADWARHGSGGGIYDAIQPLGRRLGGLGFNPFAGREAASVASIAGGDLAQIPADAWEEEGPAGHVRTGLAVLLQLTSSSPAAPAAAALSAKRYVHLARPLPADAKLSGTDTKGMLPLPSGRNSPTQVQPGPRFPRCSVPLDAWATACEQLLAAGYARHSCSDTLEQDAAELAASSSRGGPAAVLLAALPYPSRLGGKLCASLWAAVAGGSPWQPPGAPNEDSDDGATLAAQCAVGAVRQSIESAHRDIRWKARAVEALCAVADRAYAGREAGGSIYIDASPPDALLRALAATSASSVDPRLVDIACGEVDDATAQLAAAAASSPVLRLLVPLLDRTPPLPAQASASQEPEVLDESDVAQARAELVASLALHTAAVHASQQAGDAPSGVAPGVAAWCTSAAPVAVDLLGLWLRAFGTIM